MTKIAATPILGKNPLKSIYSGTKRSMTLGIGMQHFSCGSYQLCTNNNFGLAFDILELLHNMIKFDSECIYINIGKVVKSSSFITFKAEIIILAINV